VISGGGVEGGTTAPNRPNCKAHQSRNGCTLRARKGAGNICNPTSLLPNAPTDSYLHSPTNVYPKGRYAPQTRQWDPRKSQSPLPTPSRIPARRIRPHSGLLNIWALGHRPVCGQSSHPEEDVTSHKRNWKLTVRRGFGLESKAGWGFLEGE